MKKRLIVFVIAMALAPLPSAKAAPIYVFPIVGCPVKYAHSHHNYPATDILAKTGCKYVASTSGTVDEVNRVDRFNWKTNLGADRGGLFVSIVGDDGVRYYGSHLSKVATGIEQEFALPRVIFWDMLERRGMRKELHLMCTTEFLGQLRQTSGG